MPEAPLGFRQVITLRIHCPVEPATFAALVAGRGEALEADALAAPVLAAIRAAGLGDFGRYTGVVEAALGIEIFTPGDAARPTLGRPGLTSHSPTIMLTTWIDAGSPALEAALAAIRLAHPWEVPVIEISQSKLLV